jgi:hypothetical protein
MANRFNLGLRLLSAGYDYQPCRGLTVDSALATVCFESQKGYFSL